MTDILRLTIDPPGGTDPNDPSGNKHDFCWTQGQSPTTQSLSNGNFPRCICWGPGDRYKPGDTVYVAKHWKPVQGVSPGRLLNFHTCEPRGGYEQPDNPKGVSPLAGDWFSTGPDVEGDPGFRLGWEEAPYPHHYPLVPLVKVAEQMAPDKYGFDTAWEITLGRPGRVKVYVDGVLVQDRVGNTYWDGQLGYWLIEGMYRWDGMTEITTVEHVLAQVGRTPAECISDRPTLASVYGSVKGTRPNWSKVVVGTFDYAAFRYPASWGAPTPPTPPSVHAELTVAWGEWQNADLFKKWEKSNPGEAQKLRAYRAGGPRPTLATATGRALVDETAAWLAS